MDASTPQDKMLQNKYPPTIEIMVGKGPRQARVYCARPPVVLGIRAFNSDRDAIVVMLSRQAMIIAGIKAIPMVPAPCPRETRQLVAMTRPTETEITLFSPSFFSSIYGSFRRTSAHARFAFGKWTDDCGTSSIYHIPDYSASTPSSPVLTRITLSSW